MPRFLPSSYIKVRELECEYMTMFGEPTPNGIRNHKESYIVSATTEFGGKGLPTVTVMGISGNGTGGPGTARNYAVFKAMDIWRQDGEGWWNNYYHNFGSILDIKMSLVQ